jgi:hypothetical protein
MKKFKIYLTISFSWIILVGYLVWANGLLAKGSKSFRWDEWIWFGLIPAVAPYIFYYIWKPESVKNFLKIKRKVNSENRNLYFKFKFDI